MISFVVALIGLILAAVAMYALPTAAAPPVTGFLVTRVGMFSAFAAIGVGLIAVVIAAVGVAVRLGRRWALIGLVVGVLACLIALGGMVVGYLRS
ncbi:hypothetical protein [Microlunatus parietis]|uniref:Uncharacterized protein n=2 Tax=Microlunatus parietis TaxID=682979 RepID=A0A7Y9LDA9_9ACTN|nr:hypothetical protein [Microlunatus parietis]